jgi:Flagellar biosynthesis protein, FliO
MPRAFHPRLSWRGNLRLPALLVGVIGSGTLLIVKAHAGTDSPVGWGESGPARIAAAVVGSAAVSGSSPPTHAEPLVQEDQPWPSRSVKPRRFATVARAGGSDAWYWEMGVIALVLAVCGGLVAAGRRFLPQGGAGDLQIISRVSLSPKHSVYMLRAGRRMLLVGAGPQGAPALITELDDFPENEPTAPRGEAA